MDVDFGEAGIMAKHGECSAQASRRPRWMDRRRMYTGGALMILAPLGLTGCAKDDGKDMADAPADIVADRPDMPDGWVDPEIIAIAPPFDPGPIDAWPEMIAIAPFDPGPGDLPPEMIAIAPFDPGPSDAPPDIIAIAPFDPGTDVSPVPALGGFLAPCVADADCGQEYFCEVALFCIAPAPGCNEPICIPKPCGTNDACPEGAVCFPYDLKSSGSTMKVCARLTPPLVGLGQRCASAQDCASPQHFCREYCPPGLFCIAPTEVCLPIVCDPAGTPCPEGATCADVGITTACVKTP